MAVVLTLRLPKSIILGHNLQLNVKIKNNTGSFLPAQRLEAKGNSVFVTSSCKTPDIELDGEREVALTLECSGAKFISDVTGSLQLTLGKYKIESSLWQLPMYCFIGRLNTFVPPTETKSFNIYLFGIAGATKSSFINSVLTLLSAENYIVTRSAVGGGGKHTTTTLVKYNLPNSNTVFFDTWGLTQETYTSQDVLDALFIGKLPVNFSMELEFNTYRNELEQQKQTWHLRKAHGCLFFIPHGSLENPDEVDLIKTTFARIQKKHGLNPLLLLTRVDEIIPQVRINPLGNYPQLNSKKEKLAKLLDIPIRNIFYCVNYISEDKKSFELDKNTYKILERIVECASENVFKMQNSTDSVINGLTNRVQFDYSL